jgi:predicted methyltransferase
MPSSYNNVVPSVTYEGDNSVLLQQTARFILMKDKGEDLTKPNLFVRDDDIQAIIQMLKYVSAM